MSVLNTLAPCATDVETAIRAYWADVPALANLVPIDRVWTGREAVADAMPRVIIRETFSTFQQVTKGHDKIITATVELTAEDDDIYSDVDGQLIITHDGRCGAKAVFDAMLANIADSDLGCKLPGLMHVIADGSEVIKQGDDSHSYMLTVEVMHSTNVSVT